MGSSDAGMTCGVGSIVWVRRRNGSWWPGKILGPEDLSSSHITSPRSGTPVKLLGREDASVDWYNLEKSKRVKPFRCGEFDDCIERAEGAQGIPPKKREKYARREDAILHALELERQSLERKYVKVGNSSNGRRKTSPEAVISSEYLGTAGGDRRDTRSDQLPERPGISLAEKSVMDQHPHDQIAREADQLSGDDDSASVLPRMRGLQDFGLCTAPIRQEVPEVGFLTKKSRYAYLQYVSGDYPNDNQTISSQMEMLVSNIEQSGYRGAVGDDHISGSTEDTETDCSDTDSSDSDSDEMTGISDASASIELHRKYRRMIEAQDEHGSISSNDDLDELAFDEATTSMGASKWQLKAKRKNRTLGKRSLGIADVEVPRGYVNGRKLNSENSAFMTNLIDKGFRTHAPRYGSPSLQNPNGIVNLEGFSGNNHYPMRGYWEDAQESVDPFLGSWHHFGGRIMLIDVDLKVEANNYRRDVQMISLMSKLNGHAIVGHPIQVEALESNSTENLLSSADYYFTHAPEVHTRQLLSVWRTGRRTANSRAPRPFLSSPLNGLNKVHLNSSDRQNQKNLPVKKTRTVSSIGLEGKPADKGVACIPVKLVFSRLHEELVGGT